MTFSDIFQPRFRLVYAFLFGFVVSCVQQVSLLVNLNIIFLLLLIVMLIRHKLELKPYLKRWLMFHGVTLLIWLTLSWKIGQNGFEFNPQGMQLALLISLKMNLILLSLWLFLLNISDCILLQAIGGLPLPTKLIRLFVLTVRYIALLGELQQKMDIAMRARGFQPKCNRRTLQITAQRVALLLIHAMLKAEVSSMAIQSRGFRFGKRAVK